MFKSLTFKGGRGPGIVVKADGLWVRRRETGWAQSHPW